MLLSWRENCEMKMEPKWRWNPSRDGNTPHPPPPVWENWGLWVNFVKSESRSVLSDSLQVHGLYSPWISPGQNTGVGSLSLLQRIFPTQGLNPGLLHCRWILYQLSQQGIVIDLCSCTRQGQGDQVPKLFLPVLENVITKVCKGFKKLMNLSQNAKLAHCCCWC